MDATSPSAGGPTSSPVGFADWDAICRCKYRYVRGLDTKDWDLVRSTLAPDATAAYSGGGYSFDSPDAIIAFLEENMGSERLHSAHRVSAPEIEITGPDDATARWALDDVVLNEDFGVMVRGAAFYEDTYRRVDGEWRIAHTGYRRLYEELIPLADLPGRQLTASWWGTDGRSVLAPE